MKRGMLFVTLVAALVATATLAQVPTGTLTGNATDGTSTLPGVTVTITSPSLQGSRTAVTSVNGDYIFRFVPPGDYKVKFELQGFQTLDTTVKISAAQTSTVNATMPQATVAEEVTVTGSYETISTSTQAASTLTYDLVNKLPLAGNMNSYLAMSPGVTATGPSGNYTISGAQSWENLILVNGVSIQDNVRLTPHNLYIEDAVEETTTQTAAISAEYGRFAGGVVNMLTKSGGNETHGSFRLGLDSPKWSEREPNRTGILDDTINKTYQVTLGGFILKDKLWYFLGGRFRETTTSRQTWVTNVPFETVDNEKRYEGKLTYSINPNHRLIGSYLKNDTKQDNNYFGYPMDMASLYNRELPSDLLSANYSGVFSNNFFVEAQYSRKKFAFVGSGSRYTDLIKGTLMIDMSRGSSYRFWSPTFCGVCDDETRDNEEYLLKGSYFLSTESLGTHDLVAGFDSFNDERFANNYQSGSNFRIYTDGVFIQNNVIFPKILPNAATFIRWTPIFAGSRGTNFKTNSFFLNDKWRLNNNFTFNIGVRYDKNDGKDSDGKVVADDSKISPRLGLSYDMKGDGDLVFNASYGVYAAAIASGVADSTAVGGQPATIDFLYEGPTINATGAVTDTATAIGMVFDWFESVGGTNLEANPYLDYVDIPGATVQIPTSLDSTSATEWTLGATKRLGNKGMVRFDYVNREFSDFYVTKRDTSTGKVTTESGTFDLAYIVNDDNLLERTYQAFQLQASYRFTDWLNLGGNYTYSKAEGNLEGETASSGPVTSGIMSYPEYLRPSWYAPKGLLAIDQTHKVKLWVVADVLNTKHNRLSVSLLETYASGTPYGAAGTIDVRGYVTNPGYETAPTSQTYYFANRDKWRTDTETRTDLSIDYAFKLPALGTDIELFVQPRVTNVFNEKAVTLVNQAVWTSRNSGKGLTKFDPFNSTPQECTQYSADGLKCTGTGNWMKANTFGKPATTTDYQTPRTFTISFGVRF